MFRVEEDRMFVILTTTSVSLAESIGYLISSIYTSVLSVVAPKLVPVRVKIYSFKVVSKTT